MEFMPESLALVIVHRIAGILINVDEISTSCFTMYSDVKKSARIDFSPGNVMDGTSLL